MSLQFTGAGCCQLGASSRYCCLFCAASKLCASQTGRLHPLEAKEIEMSPIGWTDALHLAHEPVDRVHRMFVNLLAAAEGANDTDLVSAWGVAIHHTAVHAASENRWMRETHFADATDHQLQHRVVLDLLRDGLAMAHDGQLDAVRELACGLDAWFFQHTQAMDAALALCMRHQPEPVLNAPDSAEKRPTHPRTGPNCPGKLSAIAPLWVGIFFSETKGNTTARARPTQPPAANQPATDSHRAVPNAAPTPSNQDPPQYRQSPRPVGFFTGADDPALVKPNRLAATGLAGLQPLPANKFFVACASLP